MNLPSLFRRAPANPGRALAKLGHEQARAFVRAKTREMREQLGLEPDRRLA